MVVDRGLSLAPRGPSQGDSRYVDDHRPVPGCVYQLSEADPNGDEGVLRPIGDRGLFVARDVRNARLVSLQRAEEPRRNGSGSRLARVAPYLVLAIPAGLVALTLGLMLSYDLRRSPAYECAPVELDGAVMYPCGPGSTYQVSPSGVALLVRFLTGQPEPEPEWRSTP